MNRIARMPKAPPAALAAALLAAFAPAYGEDPDVTALTTPSSKVDAGIGIVTRDNGRFGQYTGQHKDRAYGLLDLTFNRRDDASGTWLQFIGRNLGLDSRELRLEHRQQGNWGYFITFGETPRVSPYTVSTTLSGIGTGTLAEGGEPRRDVRLETKREALGLGFEKHLGSGFDLSVRFRNENKEGTRLYGRTSVRFLVDPIDYRTQQLDGTLGYRGEKLKLTGGYYGSWFSNALNRIDATPVNASAFSPIGLPPGNQSHQFSLSGTYAFTPSAHATFHLSRARATQDDTFFLTPRSSVPRTDLGGRIDTTQAQLGIFARPLPRLSLRADLRYEDRDDKTPIYVYTTPPATGTHDGNNEPRSFKSTVGKVEASYSLPMGFRVSGGVDYDKRHRKTYAIRSVGHRDETEETSYRLELRRTLSETVNGSLSYVRSDRGGSEWLTNRLTTGAVGSNLVNPLHLADRDRDRWRLMLDWTPFAQLTLNFSLDDAKDRYSGRQLGARTGKAQLYTLDATYTPSEKLMVNGWISQADTKAEPEQAMCENATVTGGVCAGGGVGTLADPIWSASLRNIADTYGIALRSRPTARLEFGAELVHAKDLGQFNQRAVSPASAPIPFIPDANYKRTTLKLHAKWAMQKNAGIRIQYVHDRFATDDWYWTNFTYADGTTVRQDPTQKVNFIGASFYYEFR